MSEKLNRLTELEASAFTEREDLECLYSEQALTDENILRESLRIVYEVMRIVHAAAENPKNLQVTTKDDQSPVTQYDKAAEKLARERVTQVFPGSGFRGEEFAETFSQNGHQFIMDPIDGTATFISGEIEKVGVNLAVRKQDELVLAVVGNPGTGEMVYAQNQDPTRLIRLGLNGAVSGARNLPDRTAFDAKGPRVMTRFRKGKQPSDKALMDLWDEGALRHLVSPGGSPAWHLAEAAKGEYIYVHNWVRPSELEDLTAKKLVENAGGKVIDIHGNDIQLEGHKGLFLAGVDEVSLESLRTKIVQKLLTIQHHGKS